MGASIDYDRPLCRTKVHDEPIFALRIAPSGSSLVTGGGDSYLCKSSLTFNSAQGIVATHFIKQDQRISIQEPGTRYTLCVLQLIKESLN